MSLVSTQEVWMAKKRISSFIQHTPLQYSPNLSNLSGSSIYLKLENLNTTHSFKIRGAANKILSLSENEKQRGITTFSTGNFGMAVAYVAKELGIRAVICLSNTVPKEKVKMIEESEAELILIGDSQDDAEKYCYQLQKEQGLTVIHPFDEDMVIAGQGTIGLEILEDFPEVDTVLAGLSGGGLHAGLGLALKTNVPALKLIGLSPKVGATMYESIQSGKPISVPEKNTLADSLLGGIGLNNRYTFQMVQEYVDEIVLLHETEFADAMRFMLENHQMLIEGAAAAGIAGVLSKKVKLGKNTVIVITGCRVDSSVLEKLWEAPDA
ncbi:pyridoxal-phosphate dependent enzyme [Oceanobacillus piezotolerans]|uniref:threonine ammonia-lyase n=1 Tax=Oceanobacillus piezotolerans TaxID=2448030 RepID=A0A498DS18_9BACI|nr:pyridoxal-phosphate dependent enzyme [Oceanobacillus piezotolerans]RLL47777.1 pyridoxal-phosphate dependent enzyme [Oceanobacillus piezotolerans]